MWFWFVMVIRDLHKMLIVIWKVMILIFLQDEKDAGMKEKRRDTEEEALLFWIFLPYLAASKREQRQTYLLQILQKLLQIYSEDEKKKWNLAVSNGVTEPVSFRKLTMWQNISEKSINHNKQDPAGTPPAIRANLLHAGLSKGE